MTLPDYQCVLAPDGTWHLTHPQASPPPITAGGSFALCGTGGWIEFKRGYERRRPTCPRCVAACEQYEAKQAKKTIVRKPRSLDVVKRQPRRMPT